MYRASASPAIGPDKLIVRFAYQAESRWAEHDLIAHALKAGVEHLAGAHMWSDICTLPDVSHKVHSCRLKGNPDLPEPAYEDRIFRAIVYTEYYPPRSINFAPNLSTLATLYYLKQPNYR